MKTPGQKKLQAYLRTHSQTGLSRVLAVKQASVSAWVLGKSSPSHVSRIVLEIVVGIPVTDWFTNQDRARIRQAQESATQQPAQSA